MNNVFFVSLLSWFLPGFGHLWQGRIKRGIIIAVVIWSAFIIAIWSGGAYYPGFEFKDGFLLYLLNIFSRFGNGLGAIIRLSGHGEDGLAGEGRVSNLGAVRARAARIELGQGGLQGGGGVNDQFRVFPGVNLRDVPDGPQLGPGDQQSQD